jgi:hypothetical protein
MKESTMGVLALVGVAMFCLIFAFFASDGTFTDLGYKVIIGLLGWLAVLVTIVLSLDGIKEIRLAKA